MLQSIACMAGIASIGAPEICAYIDPGTGSFIFQMLIAGVLGGLLLLKIFWYNTKTFFIKLFSKGKNLQKDEE